MAHEKKGNPGTFFSYGPVDNVDVRGYPVKAVPISAVPEKAALTGIVRTLQGGSAVTPLIRRPDLYPCLVEPPGKPFITEGVFRHAVNNMQNRAGFPFGVNPGLPLPHIEPDAVIHG
jgi:hypothetical protein